MSEEQLKHGPVPEPDGPPSSNDNLIEERISYLELELKRTNEQLRELSNKVHDLVFKTKR